MAGRDDQIQEIIRRFKDDTDPLGVEEAIDQIVALHRPGGITRSGAKLYLDRGTTRSPDEGLLGLLPGLDDLPFPDDDYEPALPGSESDDDDHGPETGVRSFDYSTRHPYPD